MKAVVVGSGGWGTALSMVLCDNGHDVTLWSHDPAKAAEMTKTRENSKLKGVRLPDSLKISGDLDCLKGAELVISATPSFAVRETGKKIAPYLTPETVLVSVSKGIERDTNLRMSQILTEVTGNICKVAALSGPSHAEEVSIRMPTGCVSACPDLKVARLVQDAFMNDYFRVYTSEDIVGVELSAAMKNVAPWRKAGRHPADLRRSGRYGRSDRHLHLHALPEPPRRHSDRTGKVRTGGHGGGRRRGGGLLRRRKHLPALSAGGCGNAPLPQRL